VHRDASSLLHLRAVVFGPWSAALARNLDWFDVRLPADVTRSRAMIEDGSAWFLRYEFLLPERPGKREAMKLTVESKTGTIGAPEIERRLVREADGVIFVVDDTIPNAWQLDEALAMLEEAKPPVVVFQFDHVPYEGEARHHTPEELCARLKVGERPFTTSRAWDGTGVTETFKLLVQRIISA
jgi:hypothetical protein